MTTLREAAQQAQQALEALAGIDSGYWHDFVEGPIAALRAALAEQPAEQESVQDEYNRVINHAIEQGIEASVFLRCWREGDWSGCAEFGFEPNMAAYTAPQPAAAVSVKPVAWVDVADAEHGPYEFHGIEKLPAGKHHLFAAPPAAAVPSLASVLDAYEQQTKALPCQHEIPERGCSTYNWQMAVVRDLRAMLAAAPEAPQPVKRQPLTDEEICAALDIDGADDWTFKVAYAAIAAYERKNGIGGQP